MKRITLLFVFVGMIVFQGCEGPSGPMGPQGAPGKDGLISEVLEYTVSFNTANNFSSLVTFPRQIYSSDMVLVYRLSGVYQGADIWKLLPETYYMTDGTLDFKYDFDFTMYDANIYMEGFDLAGVSSAYRTNQVMRVVILPGFFGNKNSKKVNYNDYNAVVKAFNIDESKVMKKR